MRSVFRTAFIIFLIFAAGLAFTGCAKHPKPAESAVSPPPAPALTAQEKKKIIVAKVNGVALSLEAFDWMVNRINAINRETSTSESQEETRKRAMDQLILQELAIQAAARQGLSVEDMYVDKAMEKIIANLGHEEGYNAFLASQQITPMEMRAQVERSLLTQLIFAREVLMKISVSDEDMRKEYESHRDQYTAQEKQMTYEEAKSTIEAKLKAAAQKIRREEWEQELKKDAKIEIVK
jgi:hypothetical protein